MQIFKTGSAEYSVRYTINSLIEMEQYLGQPFTSIFSEDGISLLALRTLIFFGLKHGIHDLSHEKAGLILTEALENGQDFPTVVSLFTEEMNKALGFNKKPVEDSKN